MRKTTVQLLFLSLAMCALWMIGMVSVSWAKNDHEAPFSKAELFFELNNTDGDLGIHASIDGDPWKKLTIEDPRGRKMLNIRANGRLEAQGMTELFFESAEPQFEDLSPQEFFRRFPAGTYEIEGKTLEGNELGSETKLTHVMPAPPEPTVNALPAAQVCDADDPGYDATVTHAPVTIAWPAVTTSHPDPNGGGAGIQPPVPVVIHNYELVVEVLNQSFPSKFYVMLTPGETSITIPEEFIALGTEFKYEVLVREESFNQTAIESCFVLD
ncbi:MAG: hypothetical protein MRJ96_00850 [Nitrospirales bacterium]|nr:hypothetical protein [Nitrospira sp.]MDR4499989.1 hypothetical protein [Nitrospirales bacterium]